MGNLVSAMAAAGASRWSRGSWARPRASRSPRPRIDFRPTDSYGQAFLVGLANTLVVSVAGIILATLLGVLLGIARLSDTGWLEPGPRRFSVGCSATLPARPAPGAVLPVLAAVGCRRSGFAGAGRPGVPQPAGHHAAPHLGHAHRRQPGRGAAAAAVFAAALVWWWAGRRRRASRPAGLRPLAMLILIGVPVATWVLLPEAPIGLELPGWAPSTCAAGCRSRRAGGAAARSRAVYLRVHRGRSSAAESRRCHGASWRRRAR